MAVSGQMPGAGNLKGSEFLLFSDWKLLADRPELPLYEQINKARDILIRTAVILEDNKDTDKKHKEALDKARDDLFKLMKAHRELSGLKGADDWKNENWIKVTTLLYDLYKLQHKEKLIETDAQDRMQVP